MRLLRLVVGLAMLLASISVAPGAAEAHALKLFAAVEGAAITGMAYFSGASPARGARIVAYGPDNAVLAESVTGDDGAFSIPAGPHLDHRIVADSGDGHAAEFIVRAEEIAPREANPAPPARASGSVQAAAATGEASVVRSSDAQLAAALDAAVARHVTPLRKQLDAYEDRVRWQDVLGGIGYIFGLTGIAAYVLSRRRS